jgi:hypothetical protein
VSNSTVGRNRSIVSTILDETAGFVMALGSDWWTRLTGVVGVVSATAGALKVPGAAAELYWILSAGFLVFAAYRAWVLEHRKLVSAQARIAELAAPAGQTHRRILRDQMLTRLSPAEIGWLEVLVLHGQAPQGPELELIERKTEFARRTVRGTHFEVNPTFGPVLDEWLRDRKPPA